MKQFDQIEILLVEDNPHDAELAMRGLKQEKLANAVTWVKDGEEALDYVFRRGDYAERNGHPPRLILLDLKMPGIDGMEVLAAIKSDSSTKRIPVVIMTSSQEESDVVKSYDLGANSYIVKPLEFKAVVDAAKAAGFYWLAINCSSSA